jgi:Acetyltransferase (GNAT) domain
VELIAVGPAAREAWLEALATDPAALVSQTPAWLDCVCASGRYEDATRVYRAGDGRQLILPLARWRRFPSAASVEGSMPYGWGTGGIVCSGGSLTAADVAAVSAELGARRALRVAIRPSPAADSAWRAGVPGTAVRLSHMSQTIDLAGGFEYVSAHRFSSRVRRACRKAQRRQVTVESDATGRLIDVFDALYRKSVVRWAEQQHEPLRLAQWRANARDPRHKFETVARRLGPACRVWVAWRDSAPAAAIIVLSHGVHSTYWRGAMDRDVAAGSGANELLHWRAIEDACASGARFYHMGEAAPSSSLAHFKLGFGAVEQQHTGYRFERVPLTAADAFVRRQVKRVLRFRD